MSQWGSSELYKTLISEDNIYKAIYSMESYISEKDLLSFKTDESRMSDNQRYIALCDKFNVNLISETIKEVQKNIEKLMETDELMEVSVFFRPKKFKEDDIEPKYRPLHTSSLLNQITIVAMLNMLVFDYNKDGEEYRLSNLSKLIPSNFYGNVPSTEPQHLFKPWQVMYKKYSYDSNLKYYDCNKTGEYKYEVQLDIENFFPSINPSIIYNYIIEKLSISYRGVEFLLLQKLVFKLLYFKVNNLYEEHRKFYYPESYSLSEMDFSVGVTQGLPQSYFFGNLCMIELSKEFDKVFGGRAYYYVDDSVIFTNDFSGTDQDFSDKLKKINRNIKDYENSIEDPEYSFLSSESLKANINKISECGLYGINVHSADSKSQFSLIKEARQGEFFLKSLSREASVGAMDILSTFSDVEDITLKSRFTTLEESITKELEEINIQLDKDEKNNHLKNYKKKLLRFKKFFKYRKKIIEYREDNDVSAEKENILNYIDIFTNGKLDKNKLVKFINYYNEDIFLSELLFVLKNIRDKEAYKKIRDSINKLDKCLLGDNFSEVAYLSKILERYEYKTNFIIDPYKTLKINVMENLENFIKGHKMSRWDTVNKYIGKIRKDPKELLSKIYEEKEAEEIDKFLLIVTKNSDDPFRMIFNTFFSQIFNIDLSDSFHITKLDNRLLTYNELRIILYLRNKRFSINEFVSRFESHFKFDDNLKLDYSLFEVIDYFKMYIKEPNNIDDLIQVHRYTCDIWKNGSKHLHFYTLHNQEHAIDLIRNSINFLKCISYFQISQLDYFVLFISCYLHDISMVLYPDLNMFLHNDSIEANLIYSKYKKDLIEKMNNVYKIDSRELKKTLLEYYKRIDYYFEELVRKNHTKDSSSFIRNSNDLIFLDSAIRDIVADVSEAHGYDAREVYKIRSIAKNSLVSKKFNKIILRIADLLDMSQDRISRSVLNNNIENMSEVTRFHWLSHQLISGYEFKTTYSNKQINNSKDLINNKKAKSKEKISYLDKDNISEDIELTIYVNFDQITKVDKKEKCEQISLVDIKDPHLKLNLNESCKNESCNFLCKWMKFKNGYLFKEFGALEKYLNDTEDNYFNCNISIKIEMLKADVLNSKHFDCITEYIKA